MSQLIFTNSSQQEYNNKGLTEGGVRDTGPIGIEDPADYRNNLQNTLTIPPRSEIAVVSVELNRNYQVTIPEDARFYLYLGELLNENLDIDSVNAIPYPCRRWSTDDWDDDDDYFKDGPTTYTPIQWAQEVQRILNNSICHPDQYRNATVDLGSDGQTLDITIKNHGDKKTATINMGVTDYTGATKVQAWYLANRKNEPGEYYAANGRADTFFTQVSNGNHIERAWSAELPAPSQFWDDNCIVINRNAPLSWNQGEMIFDITDLDDEPFQIGLVRPSIPEQYGAEPGIEMRPLTYLRGNDRTTDPYCDFYVKYAYKTADASGKKYLSVYQSVNLDDHDTQGTPSAAPVIMREVQYWDALGTGGRPVAQLDEDDLIFNNPTGIVGIKFFITGNRMNIQTSKSADPALFDYPGNPGGSSGATPFTRFCEANNETGRTTENTCAPMTQNHWALYPFVNLSEENQVVKFTKYCGNTYGGHTNRQNGRYSYNFPISEHDVNNDIPDGSMSGGSSWVGFGIESQFDAGEDENNLPYGFLYRQCERFSWRNPNSANWLIAKWRYWDKLDATGVLGMDGSSVTVPEACNWVNALIFHEGDNNEYRYNLDDVYATVDDMPPNMGQFLGMPHKNLIQTVDGTTSKLDGTAGLSFRGMWRIRDQSQGGPLEDFEDDAPLALINCETLTHQTYNFCRNVPSKFLYVLPRYDSRGNNRGRMFHEVKDRTYVTLNNPDPVVLNDIRTRITDKNGVTVTDLTGETAVVYHIRGEQRSDIVTGG